MGMLMVPVFMRIKPLVSKMSCFVMSIIETAVIGTLISVSIIHNGEWLRAYYVLFVAIVVIVFSFDKGVCSKALSTMPLKCMSRIQFEFYILHQAMIKCFGELFGRVFQNINIANIAMFIAILMTSLLYKRYLEESSSYLFRRIVNKLIDKIQFDLEF